MKTEKYTPETYREKIAWNAALDTIVWYYPPDSTVEMTAKHLAFPVEPFKLNAETFLGKCPTCAESWQGVSLYKQYRDYYETQQVDISDEEIWEVIKKRHEHTHSSLLIHIPTIDMYICPFCGDTFRPETKKNDDEIKE
ncbi:hypothetical protein FACS18945_6180 [Bacteroidia bacterium]|nr:hypothetical protein FACS18945_6180 [Bacteroidia bacterium]